MLFRSMLALTSLMSCASAELIQVAALIDVDSTSEELNTLNQDRTIIAILQTALDRPGGILCESVCSAPAYDNCVDCGQIPFSAEKRGYSLIFTGSTELSFRAVEVALKQPIEDLFGAEDVREIGIYELSTPEVVYATVSLSTTLQQVVTDLPTIATKMDTVLERDDSSCLKLCEEVANVCHPCDVDTTTTSGDRLDLIVVMKGRAYDYADLTQFNNELHIQMRDMYPNDFRDTSISFINPELPREEDSSHGDTEAPLPLTPGTTQAPDTLAPLGGGEQVLVIRYQITIEFDTLSENSETLALKSSAALGGSTGECVRICGTQEQGDKFIATATCFQCSGQSLSLSRGNVLEAKRWEITLSGRAAIDVEEYSRLLAGSMSPYIHSIGGSLDSISVSNSGVILPAHATDSDDGLTSGAVAGIVIGCVTGIVIIAVVVYCCVCKKSSHLPELPEQREHEFDKKAPDSTV